MTFDITDNDIEQPPLPVPGIAKEPDHKRELSPGEKLFDRVTYTGIGFGVNEASSLWITDQFMHGKNLLDNTSGLLKKMGSGFSAEGFGKASEWMAKTFKFTEKLEHGVMVTPKQRGGNLLLMLTLLSGGTLLILPMKKLENDKQKWVKRANHFIDKMRGNEMSKEETEARDAKVEQDIACSPRQTWPSFLLGRIIAVSSSVLTGTFIVGHERNQKIMEGSDKFLSNLLNLKSEKTHRYASLMGIETYSCFISSAVLELASKFTAKRGTTVHDPQMCQSFHAEGSTSAGQADSDATLTDPRADKQAAPAASYAEKIRLSQAANLPMQVA